MAFCRTNEKIFNKKNNGNFLSLIEIIAEFDLIVQEYIRRIQNGEFHNHYLRYNIQNELCTIIKNMKEAKYFSIVLNCTPVASHQEQMILVLGCVNISTTTIEWKNIF